MSVAGSAQPASLPSGALRLGVYSDMVYRRQDGTVYAHQAFVQFITSMPPRVREIVVFGRLHPEPATDEYAVTGDRVRFVALPHYAAVTAIGGQICSASRSSQILRRELPRLDALWVFGPHPMAVVLALTARRNRTPLFLGIRQDYPSYIRHRLPGRRWVWAVAAAAGLEHLFRRLARDAPTVAVGDALARNYRGAGTANVLSTGFSLVSSSDLLDEREACERMWGHELRILTVGRLASEKNSLLLADIAAQLVARDPRWRMLIVGDGPLAAPLSRRLDELGVSEAVDLLGYVPSGHKLRSIYRESHVFLHVSLTEGVPQVLWEAQAAGTPVVATDVGGVRGAVGEGNALLIPPNDAKAAAAAVERLREQPAERLRLVRGGLANASAQTMEAQLDRIVRFFEERRAAAVRAPRRLRSKRRHHLAASERGRGNDTC